jgi:hypothetical protein
MRAKEFITENKDYEKDFAADHKDWEPREIAGAFTVPDASANFYKMYRYGILMARSPEPQPDAYDDQTAFGDKLIIAPYSDGDIAAMQGASSASGHAAVKSHHYNNKSENPQVNQVSPVAKFVPTKRPSHR